MQLLNLFSVDILQINATIHPYTILHDFIPPRITCRWILLGLIAIARGCSWLTEQPRSSLMPFLAYFKFAALAIRPSPWESVSLPAAQCPRFVQTPLMQNNSPRSTMQSRSDIGRLVLSFANYLYICCIINQDQSPTALVQDQSYQHIYSINYIIYYII